MQLSPTSEARTIVDESDEARGQPEEAALAERLGYLPLVVIPRRLDQRPNLRKAGVVEALYFGSVLR